MAASAEATIIPRRPAYLVTPSLSKDSFPDLPQLPIGQYSNDSGVRLSDPNYVRKLNQYKGDVREQFERAIHHAYAGPYLDAGERIVNGVRLKLAETTTFGLGYQEARDFDLLQDHGFFHERRWDKWKNLLVLNSPNLHISDLRLLYSLSEFVNHDRDQLITEARNLSREQKGLQPLDPKLGHGPAGAVRTMVLAPRYAKEAQISAKGAREIAYISGLMMLLHDEPEQLERALLQTEIPNGRKAYKLLPSGQKEILRGDDLMNAYFKGVDLLSLLPSQIVEITWRLKRTDKKGKDAGFVTLESKRGLDPIFETEFAEELDMLEHGNYQNLGEMQFIALKDNQEELPLGNTISEQFRKEFTLVTRIAQFADQLDMVIPFRPALMRKFWNRVSMERGFFRKGILERILHGDDTPVDAKGNSADSDLGRGIYEIVTLRDRILPRKGQQSQSLSESPFIKRLVEDIQVAAIMEQMRSGLILMSGDRQAIQQLVKETFTTELLSITNKMLNRANIIMVDPNDKEHPFTPENFFHEAVKTLSERGFTQYANRLIQLQKENESAYKQTMTCIHKKIKTYTQADKTEFETACRTILKNTFGKTDEEINDLVEKMHDSQLIELPYTTYYSSGKAEQARVYTRRESSFAAA